MLAYIEDPRDPELQQARAVVRATTDTPAGWQYEGSRLHDALWDHVFKNSQLIEQAASEEDLDEAYLYIAATPGWQPGPEEPPVPGAAPAPLPLPAQLFPMGGTQQLYGLWDTNDQAWVRDAGGSVAMLGKAQAESLLVTKNLVLKELYICAAENLVDEKLLALRQRWAAHGL